MKNIKLPRNMFGSRRRRFGVVLVETALIFPMLLALTFGVIQYGIIMNASNALSNIAREGARNAALNPFNDVNVKAIIKQQCAKTAINYSDITSITFDPPTAAARTPGTLLTVTLTYPMSKKVFLPSTILGAPIFNSTVTQSGSYLVEGLVPTPTP